ncbi:MAG: LacI family DNA-binding transcriptional regulator [Candidatus Aureabacteria bacterium]|nr:LacI family DNA-binding transcriptional regulator [Candidatus Auribacterota bacterium]
MAVTLKEIARIADVNISTVSRALNDSPLITLETKEKILAIAERMNYFPNSLARGLVSHKSETIGIILPKIFFLQGPFFSEVLSGIEQVSVKNGYNILIASATGKKQEKNFPFNLTRAKRIDGMLIINEQQRIRNLLALKKESFPFVFLNRFIKDTQINCVASDNVQGGHIATQHLTRLGHKRIAVITGSLKMAASHERLQGYRAALEEAGIPFDRRLVQEGLFEQGIESGVECATRLIEQSPLPTAIFAFSDEIAIGVMQVVKSKGLKIPEDIAIIGYDNIEYSAHLSPPLTTISQNPFTIGSASCQMLIDILSEKKVENNHIRISVNLVIRESCGYKQKKRA